eukprot:CAMPEP_0173158834 /NCGR_PEP_ID=MMETSP1105-20130129/16682_1 /TAXON_ID=2985 /ORGANISM="Ochromonas sp., Strain BG-1" /LENGTH=218 /DNA_ID=CAMNT_0014077017 /DNA_START=32 /DNA_END=687 /DNA_ORIENTATION=+
MNWKGEALKTRNQKVWIDDGVDESDKKRIRTQLDEDIARAIDETECMLVIITKKHQKEFKYGFDRLQKRVIPIIVDSDVWKDIGNETKTLNALGEGLDSNTPGFFYHDLSRISDSSTLASKESLSKNIDELFNGFRVLLDCLTGASESKHKRKRKHDSSDGDEAEEIQVEEKRSHGDGKAAEKKKTKEEGNKRKKNRKHKKAKRNKQVLDPAEEEKIE